MSDAPAPRPVLDVFFDLQCPDCHAAQEDLRLLRERYPDSLEIRIRHFPLAKHRHAYAAAQAAEEAWAQGRGEEYTAALLELTAELGARGEAVLVEVAKRVGMDSDEVETALIDGRHLLAVDADQAEGQALGVHGTPTYLIDGQVLDGSRSQDGLREKIEQVVNRLPADG
ncbi:DsbA family protein [Streptomyces sp. 549]|uniref:DsbA family protein n=1 Tax=Streptomyces sp. 549 TaxID=3049076 RepID=UPI0024C38B6B|nr:DsbA family protein [Streptomyces sp. 549]MDK1473437.1 DsbA family protein [Streptomyces sp. 549]